MRQQKPPKTVPIPLKVDVCHPSAFCLEAEFRDNRLFINIVSERGHSSAELLQALKKTALQIKATDETRHFTKP
jgi:hypothetical protein